MAESTSLADLNDVALPDLSTLTELQIPAEFDFGDFDEAALLGRTPSLIVDDEVGTPGCDNLSWLPPPLSESRHSSETSGASTAHQWQHTRPSPSAVLRGKVERRAEQNRCI
jgi:hypothetical protein